MNLIRTIPAATAPAREGLELSVHRTEGARGTCLRMHADAGEVVFVLGAPEGTFIFTHGRVQLEPAGDATPRAFVDDVARWLGLELGGPASPEPPTPALDATWVRIGRGDDGFGAQWDTFKLFLSIGERHAEVFLRLSADGTRAQLVEKWSQYREDLVAILERALSDDAPRAIRARTARVLGPDGERLLSIDGAVEVAVPHGWRASAQPAGHWRLTDSDDETTIEFSYMRLPPLPSDAPTAEQCVRLIVERSGHRDVSGPIETFMRDGVSFAWAECRYDSPDDKRPAAPPRAARGRWLIASNDWTRALVTGCWWEADAASGEAAWRTVTESLRLAGRIEPAPASDRDA